MHPEQLCILLVLSYIILACMVCIITLTSRVDKEAWEMCLGGGDLLGFQGETSGCNYRINCDSRTRECIRNNQRPFGYLSNSWLRSRRWFQFVRSGRNTVASLRKPKPKTNKLAWLFKEKVTSRLDITFKQMRQGLLGWWWCSSKSARQDGWGHFPSGISLSPLIHRLHLPSKSFTW